MIKTILFSKDRAMQLDATLASFFLHCRDAENANIQVIYLASDLENEQRYGKLIQTYPAVNFISQTMFQNDLERILNPFLREEKLSKKYYSACRYGHIDFSTGSFMEKVWRHTFGQYKISIIEKMLPSIPEDFYLLLLVDDNLFVRDFNLSQMVNSLMANQDAIGVSLRLGRNTDYCYALSRSQKVPEFTPLPNGFLKYDWTSAEFDFGYPLEVSSSIYQLKTILAVLISRKNRNPNDLEDFLAANQKLFREKFPYLLCNEQTITFCNPINVVQNTINNRAGEKFKYTVQEMNERFDLGERVNIESFVGFVPNGCHQEVELNFRRA